MKVTRPKASIYFLGFVALSCSSDLPGGYIVYEEAISPGKGQNVLMCKLGCASDANVADVKSIHWSDSLMYIDVGTKDERSHYIIKATGSRLTCCNQDTLIGPLNISDFKRSIVLNKLPEKLEHTNSYR